MPVTPWAAWMFLGQRRSDSEIGEAQLWPDNQHGIQMMKNNDTKQKDP